MARIIGAIATSHTPTIGFAFDNKKQEDPVWKPDLRGLRADPRLARRQAPGRAVLHLQRPRHVVLLRSLLGVRARHRRASMRSPTKAAAPRALPPIKGHAALARHIGASLMADEFDMSFFQDKPLDHGCFSPLSMLLPHEPELAGADRAAADRRAAVPDPERRALLQARPVAAHRDRELPGGHQGRHRRHRRPVAPGPRRALRASTTRRGTTQFMDLFENDPSALDAHDPRRIRRRSAAWKAPRSSCGWSCAARCRPASSACTAPTTCRR